MKIFVLLLACLLPASAIAAQHPSPPASEATKAIVKSYLEIQTALAADKFNGVKGPAGTLAAQAAALGNDGEAIGKAATSLGAAADLKAARDAFGPLSDAVIARVQKDGSKDLIAELRLAYCPMAGRAWLQREKQIRNPHYGAQMLTCGEFRPIAPAKDQR